MLNSHAWVLMKDIINQSVGAYTEILIFKEYETGLFPASIFVRHI
jgi:hypothetical protein